MKKLFVTASAAALMLGAVACSNADSDIETASVSNDEIAAEEQADAYDTQGGVYADTQTDAGVYDGTGTAGTLYGDDAEMAQADIEREYFTPASGEFMASDLIGKAVIDAAGEDIGEVEDITLSTTSVEPMLIVRDGVAGDLRSVSFEKAAFSVDADGEPVTTLNLADTTLESMPEFEQNGMNDYRLMSEVMGTNLNIAYNDKNARVTDFVVASNGEAKYAVISDGVVEAITSDRYLVKPEKIILAQGDSEGELVLDITPEEYSQAWGVQIEE